VEDVSGTVIRFESGGLAVVVDSNGGILGRWESEVKVILPGLTADFVDANRAVCYHTGGPWLSQTEVQSVGDVYLAETLDLLGAIEEDRPPAVPIMEGVRSLRLALAATESAMQDMPVDIVV